MKLTVMKAGFALPTVLIASVTMLIVLLATLSATTSVSTALESQYYDKLAQEAAESGLAMAHACIVAQGTANWSSSSPLRPNTDCGGGNSCTSGPTCYVLSQDDINTTFMVGAPKTTLDGSYLVTATATVQQLRTSNGEVWQTYSGTASVRIPSDGTDQGLFY